MEGNFMDVCSEAYVESKPIPSDVYGWWDCDFDFSKSKKKKRKKKKNKAKKRAKKKFVYHLLDKATDTACDVIKLYFEQKFNS